MAAAKSTIAADFAQLQREYRNMEQNRKAYTEESQNIIRRQQAAINKLQKDEEQLKAELAMEARHASKAGEGMPSQLTRIQDQGDQFTQKLAVETRNLEELDKAIQIMQSKILQQRKLMGGVNAAKENQRMIQKQIRILENRLDKALIKFNEALAHNKLLRETIDNLRRERVVFDNIYRKLEKELHEKKKQMANIIELSNQAYEVRDAAQMEITAYEQQNSKEQVEFESHMVELDRVIEEDRKRKDIAMKEQSRDLQRGEMTLDEETRFKKKVTKGVWAIAKDKANVQVAEMKVQSYEEAFNKIKAATGITDIDKLVTTFIQNEEQNFSLFNFVNEQNNEIEKIEEQMQQLYEEERKYTQESGDDVNQHKQLLYDLEQRLQQTESAAEKYELKYQEASKTINALKLGIQSIFHKIECNSSAMSELLSDTQVTEANVMQFLGIIEQRTNEILQAWAGHQRQQGLLPNNPSNNKDETISQSQQGTGGGLEPNVPNSSTLNKQQLLANILGQGPTTPMGQEGIQINPPNLEDYSSDEESDASDTEQRPLTHDELKVKTLKSIHKRSTALGREQRKGNHAHGVGVGGLGKKK